MKINSQTVLYGLLGYPVRHSKSPDMHNAAFSSLGIDAVYLCFEVKPEELKSAIAGIRGLGISGVNVTIPHKQAVIKYLDEITEVARRIGAVNTIFRRGDKLIGTNTDAEGFIRDLRDTCRFSAKNKQCIVIGAGGGARAVCFGLADAGAKTIFVKDKTVSKAKRLVSDLKKEYSAISFEVVKTDAQVKRMEFDLLVNATPVGMKPSDGAPIDLGLFSRLSLVYDLIYNPKMTPLLKKAKKMGISYANGLGMLVRQGAVSFKHWTKKNPPIDVMFKAVK